MLLDIYIYKYIYVFIDIYLTVKLFLGKQNIIDNDKKEKREKLLRFWQNQFLFGLISYWNWKEKLRKIINFLFKENEREEREKKKTAKMRRIFLLEMKQNEME